MKSSADARSGDAVLPERNVEFAKRLKDAVGGRNQGALAKEVGIAGSTLFRYMAGSMPAADIAFRLARALNVRPAWLIEGEEPKLQEAGTVVGISGDVVVLPRFDLFAFGEYGKPDAAEMLALPAPLLARATKATTNIWLAEMPNDALPSLAQEGELLVCRDPEPVLQDRRIYVFLVDGRPIVRKAYVRPEGLQLRSEDDGDTILVTPSELEQIRPIGRVLSAISVHSA